MELPNELNFNILINVPINDLIEICQVNMKYNDICHNDYFWKSYFTHNNLPQLIYLQVLKLTRPKTIIMTDL